MAKHPIPANLQSLQLQEEFLRSKAVEIVERDGKISLHLEAIVHSMDLADLLRQFRTSDEEMKVIQMLGMRIFNAFGASLKLALSGYSQNSALILRDILETVFLLDYFKTDRRLIERWRHANKKERMKHFSPLRVREALDVRDGFIGKKRYEMYEMFSELAGHPNMNSIHMMRPQKGGDAVIGPFVEATTIQATLSEMGRLAVQAGEALNAFYPENWEEAYQTRVAFQETKHEWMAVFYPKNPET